MEFNINKDRSVTVTSETIAEATMLFNLVLDKKGSQHVASRKELLPSRDDTMGKSGRTKYKKSCPHPDCAGSTKRYKSINSHIWGKHRMGGKVGWHRTGNKSGNKYGAMRSSLSTITADRPALID